MSSSIEFRLREELAGIARRAYERHLTSATDGNASARLPDGSILVTPSGSCLGDTKPEDFVKVDEDGRVLAGEGRPTSELALHAAVYRARPDVRAVLHAHPTAVLSLNLAGVGLDACLLPELVLDLGSIPTAPYAAPASPEGPIAIAELILRADALILDRHGSLTVGSSPAKALHRLERMEHAAQVILDALSSGRGLRALDLDQVARLQQLRYDLGLTGFAPECGR